MRAEGSGETGSGATRTLLPTAEPSGRTWSSPGTSVGRYLVMSELGRGGMGIVLRAYDPRLQREIALKTVHAEGLTERSHEAMMREAQTMARLSHPNVVAVYDAQELGGDVVIAMEYVEGTTLAKWTDALHRDRRRWKDVLEAFVAAGRGLAAAHAAGILHRDFKPTNVLVGKDGRVRVTDFGIARMHDALRASGSNRDAEIAGSPRYMAPEQLVGAELTPASDQYGFCVALFESLTETRAFVGGSRGVDELAAHKRSGPPRWPYEKASGVAGGVPGRVIEAIERGLQPNPGDRWPTMDALLDALSADENRRRISWLSAAIALPSIAVVGLAATHWLETRSQRCSGGRMQIEEVWNPQRRAEVEAAVLASGLAYAADTWRTVAPTLDAYATSWAAGHRDACEATTVRREQPTEILDSRMACLHRAKIQFAAAVELLAHADDQTTQKASDVVGGLPVLRRCSEADGLDAEVAPPHPEQENLVEIVRVKASEASVLRDAGKVTEAKRIAEDITHMASSIAYAPLNAEISKLWGTIHMELGQYAAGRAAFGEALVHALRSGQRWEAQDAASFLISTSGFFQGRLREARAYIPVALGLARKGGLEEAHLRYELGLLHHRQGAFEEAEREFRATIALHVKAGAPEVRLLKPRGQLGYILQKLGRFEESEREQRAVVAASDRVLGREHPASIGARINLSNSLRVMGRYAEAEEVHHEAFELAQKVFGPEHPNVGLLLNNYGLLLTFQRRHARAQEVLRRAMALWETLPMQPARASAHLNMGWSFYGEGRLAEAEAEYRIALDMHVEMFGPDAPAVATVRKDYGEILYAMKRHDDALEQLHAALAVYERDDGPTSAHVARIRRDLGAVLGTLGRYDEADAELQRAESALATTLGAEHPEVLDLRARRETLAVARQERRKR